MRAPTSFTRRSLAAAGAALIVIASTVLQAAGATPAAAATIPVGSVQVVTAESGLLPGSSKTITATCPAAKPRVVGGGYTTTGAHVVVTALQPLTGLTDSYRVTAQADEFGISGSWNLQAHAYCSNVAPGWQLVTATSTTTSNPFNQLIVTCPSGKAILGTGGTVNGGGGQVQLVTQTLGSVGPNKMSAAGIEDPTGFGGSWSVTGYAICVTTTSSLDIRHVQNQTALDGVVTKTVAASCPSGFRVTGSSVWANHPAHAISLRPNNITPTSVTAVGRNDTGTTSSWDVTVYIICAR